MAKAQHWVSKADQTLAGRRVHKGQIIRPTGARNDQIIFGDNTRWAFRYDGDEPLSCGTDGCDALFADLGVLDRHRLLQHAPERDARERDRLARAEDQRSAEEAGQTVGGHEVVKTKRGPRGEVPYIEPLS